MTRKTAAERMKDTRARRVALGWKKVTVMLKPDVATIVAHRCEIGSMTIQDVINDAIRQTLA